MHIIVLGQTQIVSCNLDRLSCLDRQVWILSGQTKNKILIGLHVWTDSFGVVSGQTQVVSSSLGSVSSLDRQVWVVSGQTKSNKP